LGFVPVRIRALAFLQAAIRNRAVIHFNGSAVSPPQAGLPSIPKAQQLID
jgi:hypothetical protein